jgi:hypothetical protein
MAWALMAGGMDGQVMVHVIVASASKPLAFAAADEDSGHRPSVATA